MNLIIIADQLQEKVNEMTNNHLANNNQNIEAIHKLSSAQKLIEEAYAMIGKEGAIPLDFNHFIETGEKIAKWK